MYTVYIIDDNILSINQVENIIELFSKEQNNFKVGKTIRVNEGFEEFKNNHMFNNSQENIYFVNISLRSTVSGLEIAREIRKYDYLGNIIILTSDKEMAQISYRYYIKAINFIEKNPLEYEIQIKKTLQQIISNDLRTKNSPTFTFRSKNSLKNIAIKNILFFETTHKKRCLILHTLTDSMICNGTIKELEKKLPNYFIRCHKSFILNTHNIEEINISKKPYQAIFTNGKSCVLSTRFITKPVDLLHYRKK